MVLVATVCLAATPAFAHASVTLYSQSDATGEMVSQQPTFLNTFIESASLGNLFLGKGRLTLTFTIQAPSASNEFDQPGGVALESCTGCQDLQTYYFTDADRTLLADGAFHTFRVETGTTTLGVADGSIPIYRVFFNLPQYHGTNHSKSNAAGTIPYLLIEADTFPIAPVVPQAPPGSLTLYTQSDSAGVMTNPQATFQNAYIDSASLGTLPLGQGPLYLTFTMKDPDASNYFGTPIGVCLQPANTVACNNPLQTYHFTNADRDLLSDHAYHTFMVETGTTTSTYADGTRPVSISFYGLSQYQFGTKIKSNAVGTIPTLLIQTPPPSDPCALPGACVSNVLFLPGTQASRLYYRDLLGVEHQVWEPNYRTDIPYLAMNADGTSQYALYTKDIVDRIQANNLLEAKIAQIFGANLEVYKGFKNYMNGLVADDIIKEWRAYPYDWRYDVFDVVEDGARTRLADGSIGRVYLVDMLKEMASSSPSGKVTIVAHSNGGLLAKALASALGGDASRYIDQIVMVGTPQWGTPAATGALLHADNFAGLPKLVINSVGARAVERDMGGLYSLFPSSTYFSQVADPVVTFDPSGFLTGPFATKFGAALTSPTAFRDFITDAFGLDASTGDASNLRALVPLRSDLLTKAVATHAMLDAWTPPAGIAVTAIAGWGQDTIKTLAYTSGSRVVCSSGLFLPTSCANAPELLHTAVLTQDGDGTVVSPSAIGSVGEKLYFNALDFVLDEKKIITHQNLTSAAPIQNTINALLTNGNASLRPYISTTRPLNGLNPIVRISSHSPVNLVATDATGRQSGVLPMPGTDFAGIIQDIPGSSVQVLDDEEYINVPQSGSYHIVATGYATGSATLQVENVDSDGVATSTALFTDIPTSASSTATFSVTTSTVSAPVVDVNGDGVTDFTAVSATPGTDPLAYVRYMQAVVQSLPLKTPVKQQITAKLAGLAKDKKLDARKIEQFKAFVEQRASLPRNAQDRLPADNAEIILGMINRLKTLI